MKNFQNNSAAVVEEIKSFIRNNAPTMTAYSAQALSRASDSDYFDMSLEFIDQDLDCRVLVYVRNNKSWNVEQDQEGNVWRIHNLTTEVNWSAYGSTSSKLAVDRLAFMNKVASFAAALENAFPNEFYTLKETAHERALKRAESVAIRLAKENTKNLRVGGSKVFDAPMDSMVGIYPFEDNSKSYTATVTGYRKRHGRNHLIVTRVS